MLHEYACADGQCNPGCSLDGARGPHAIDIPETKATAKQVQIDQQALLGIPGRSLLGSFILSYCNPLGEKSLVVLEPVPEE